MTELLAWVWLPAVFLALTLGIGLLVDLVLAADIPSALLPAVGLTVLIVVATLGYRAGVPSLVPAVVTVLALAGLVACRSRLRRLAPDRWALGAALAVYGLYLAPVVLSGSATWLGYNFVNDTASNFLLIEQLGAHGAVAPAADTGGASVTNYLISVGYPLGAFGVVAAVKPLTGAPLEAVYQPLIAVMAALGAMSLRELAGRMGLDRRAAALAAVLSFAGVLLYRYSLHGAIKEVLLVTLLLTAVGVTAVAIERGLPIRLLLIVATVCLGMLLVFSTAALAFAAALAGGAAIVVWRRPERPSRRHVLRVLGAVGLLGVLGAIPVLGSLLDFTQNVRGVFDASTGVSTGEFGQLVRPLPVAEAAGTWLARDYRYPADVGFNAVLVAVTAVAALAGVVLCAVRGRWPGLLLLVAVVVPAVPITILASPYIDGKMLVLATPVVVLLAAFAALTGVRAPGLVPRLAGSLALVLMVAGIGWSVAYSYRDARAAPVDRVDAMKDVAAAVPDRGLYLLNEWEEYGKVFMAAARVNPAAEANMPRPVQLRGEEGVGEDDPDRTPVFGRWFDLDRQTPRYLQGFSGVIMRRSPVASRPPANFRLIHRNRYYELWQRDRGRTVLHHLPLQGTDRATAVPDCRVLRRFARRARPGQQLVAAERPRVARITPKQAQVSPNWPESGDVDQAVTTAGAGTLRARVTAAGRQRVWVRASATRDLTVLVDGRRVGAVRQINTPSQWLEAGTIDLGPGSHRIEVRRGTASWRPGDGAYGFLGPVALESIGAGRLVSVAPQAARRLCGRPWDWIEIMDSGTR